MSKTIIHETTLVVITCYSCGTPFGVERNLQRRFLEKGDSFYCPNGHCQVYSKSTTEKLDEASEELKRLEAQLASRKDEAEWYAKAYERRGLELKDTANQLRAQKAAKTRLKNRIKNGVCPCCHRQFTDLQRHMESKHPDYSVED